MKSKEKDRVNIRLMDGNHVAAEASDLNGGDGNDTQYWDVKVQIISMVKMVMTA